MKLVYAAYLAAGAAFAVLMLYKQEEQYDCASQLGRYELVAQATSPYAHSNAHYIAVEYAAALIACKKTPDLISKPAAIVLAAAQRQDTKDEALKLLQERKRKRTQ